MQYVFHTQARDANLQCQDNEGRYANMHVQYQNEKDPAGLALVLDPKTSGPKTIIDPTLMWNVLYLIMPELGDSDTEDADARIKLANDILDGKNIAQLREIGTRIIPHSPHVLSSNNPISALLVFLFPRGGLATRVQGIGLLFDAAWYREAIVTQLNEFHESQVLRVFMEKYAYEYVLHFWYVLQRIISEWDGVSAGEDNDDGDENGGKEGNEEGKGGEEEDKVEKSRIKDRKNAMMRIGKMKTRTAQGTRV